MSSSAIYMRLATATVVAAGGTVPLGSTTRRFGCDLVQTSDGIVASGRLPAVTWTSHVPGETSRLKPRFRLVIRGVLFREALQVPEQATKRLYVLVHRRPPLLPKKDVDNVMLAVLSNFPAFRIDPQ